MVIPMEKAKYRFRILRHIWYCPVEIEEPDTSRLARGDKKSKLYTKKQEHLSSDEHPPHLLHGHQTNGIQWRFPTTHVIHSIE